MRGHGGEDVLVCGHLAHVKYGGGQRGWSAAAEFEVGKLALHMHSMRDMVRAHIDLTYINPTPSSVGGGTPPHIMNKVLIW